MVRRNLAYERNTLGFINHRQKPQQVCSKMGAVNKSRWIVPGAKLADTVSHYKVQGSLKPVIFQLYLIRAEIRVKTPYPLLVLFPSYYTNYVAGTVNWMRHFCISPRCCLSNSSIIPEDRGHWCFPLNNGKGSVLGNYPHLFHVIPIILACSTSHKVMQESLELIQSFKKSIHKFGMFYILYLSTIKNSVTKDYGISYFSWFRAPKENHFSNVTPPFQNTQLILSFVFFSVLSIIMENKIFMCTKLYV